MAQPGTDHSAAEGGPLAGETRTLLDALPTPSLLLDPQGRVRHANPALELLAGYPAERLVTQGPRPDPGAADDAARHRRHRALRNSSPPARTGRASGPGLRRLSCAGTPFRIGQIRDETARREAEARSRSPASGRRSGSSPTASPTSSTTSCRS
ncbi:PAS domain-containing protein [Methylobacterium oryzae CBMB20]